MPSKKKSSTKSHKPTGSRSKKLVDKRFTQSTSLCGKSDAVGRSLSKTLKTSIIYKTETRNLERANDHMMKAWASIYESHRKTR